MSKEWPSEVGKASIMANAHVKKHHIAADHDCNLFRLWELAKVCLSIVASARGLK